MSGKECGVVVKLNKPIIDLYSTIHVFAMYGQGNTTKNGLILQLE